MRPIRQTILRQVRTEHAKAVRRQYGDNSGMCKFKDHRLEPRPDGISNALTTFDKDNYVLVEYGKINF